MKVVGTLEIFSAQQGICLSSFRRQECQAILWLSSVSHVLRLQCLHDELAEGKAFLMTLQSERGIYRTCSPSSASEGGFLWVGTA